MLDLDKSDSFTETHPETGVEFDLKPVDPREYDRLQKKAGKGKGDADPIVFAGLFAAHAVLGWRGVKQDCTDEAKRKFGEKFAYNIVPWMVGQCMDAARAMTAEVDAAKND